MPIERAVPSMIFIACSTVLAFRSGPVTRMAIRRGDTQQLANLARLAEERSQT